MGMVDGLISQLESSPIVQNAMSEFAKVRDIFVATVKRFDHRFDELEIKMNDEAARTKEILQLIKYPPDVAAAGEHVLQLPQQTVAACTVEGCIIPSIHEHGDGVAVSKNFFQPPVPETSFDHGDFQSTMRG